MITTWTSTRRRLSALGAAAAVVAGGAVAPTLTSAAPATPDATTSAGADRQQAEPDAVWTPPNPLVVGHRGIGGYVPEHTLASYALAAELGADCIEPDLVATKDGVLIARHEPNLVATTDVADRPEFADRFTTKIVDGVPTDGWFASDFTLAEIKKLRAVQPFAERYDGLDGDYRIPTFTQVVDLAKRLSRTHDRTICVVPETKHPTFHADLGLPLEDRLVDVLVETGWNRAGAPVIIQSFEQANLQHLDTVTPVRLVQLIDANDVKIDGSLDLTAPYDRPYDWTVAGRDDLYTDLVTPEGLAEIATYADAIGPWKPYLMSSAATDADGDGAADDVTGDGRVDDRDRSLLPPSDVIDDAHDAGLLVMPYTFRDEQGRLAGDYAGDPAAEYRAFYELGVDGLFSDFAGTAFAARAQLALATDPTLVACLKGGRGLDPERCRDIAPQD